MKEYADLNMSLLGGGLPPNKPRELDDDGHVVYGWRPQPKFTPLTFTRGENSRLWDRDGRCFIDIGAGQMSVNIGYGHPKIQNVMRRGASELTYVAPYFATEARSLLARRVAARLPGDLNYVFFCNGGSDAIETALKVARAYTGRTKIIAAWQSYHGATAGASAISGDARRLMAEPLIPGVGRFHVPGQYRSPFGATSMDEEVAMALEAVDNLFKLEGPNSVAAIVIEPIIGGSGLYVLPSKFLHGLRSICNKYGCLLIADETICAWGRCGEWFSSHRYGLVPDIITTAKGVTSGYMPFGLVGMNENIRDFFNDRAFVGGLTTEGHALACSVALANMEVYEEEALIERSSKLGEYLLNRLNEIFSRHSCIGEVRGSGLYAVIEFTADRGRKSSLAAKLQKNSNSLGDLVYSLLLERGIITMAKNDFLFVAPPLTIPEVDLDYAIKSIDEVVTDIDHYVD
uniref:aminotransferase class III-fold pyridoxal phosphate-dependent enzyme n=1 Tax=Methylobacterium oryzae TaxID=334852 RepID=UPI00155DB8D4|nr:aminotransferase class III-fold pyridoxal phosphate-dependent enzyme [Methylobacterium oryzae]